MKTEKFITDDGVITTDITKARFLKIMSFDNETGDILRSWTIEIHPDNIEIHPDNIEKSLIHLDLSHHNIQVLGYFRNSDITIENDKMFSSGMMDSLKALERLNLIDSRTDKHKTVYYLNSNGNKVLREL